MRELNYFLKLQIKQLKDNIFINQAKYIKYFLKRLKMEDVKTMGTPMSSSITFDKYEQGQSIDSILYRGITCSLLYLTSSRLDIMFGVCLSARFQSCLKKSYLSVIKRSLRYLKWILRYPSFVIIKNEISNLRFLLIRFNDHKTRLILLMIQSCCGKTSLP